MSCARSWRGAAVLMALLRRRKNQGARRDLGRRSMAARAPALPVVVVRSPRDALGRGGGRLRGARRRAYMAAASIVINNRRNHARPKHVLYEARAHNRCLSGEPCIVAMATSWRSCNHVHEMEIIISSCMLSVIAT